MKFGLTVFVLLALNSAGAQTGTVTKVKSGKALVEFGDQNISEGQKVIIGNPRVPASLEGNSELRRRQHGLHYNLSYQNIKPDPGVEEKSTLIDLKYGFNIGSFEFGPSLRLSTLDLGGLATDTNTYGLFFQYNLIENAPENDWVPYFRGCAY